MPLRVVFMGTPDFSVPTLMAIAGQGHAIVAVYSQPPRPAGRGWEERPSPVHRAAATLGIPVLTPTTLRDPAVQEAFAVHAADVALVVAYGLLLPPPILEAPREGCLNVHASLLPRWRGAAPIQRAIMAGDPETGVMIMRMEAGLDTGPVCLAERTAIAPGDTAGTLHDRLAALGADLAVRALAALERGSLDCIPQPEAGVTYAAKIDKAEARIAWSLPAEIVLRRIRALSPAPGAWFEFRQAGGPERIKLIRAAPTEGAGPPGTVLSLAPLAIACGEDAVEVLELQRAGRKPGGAAELVRGARLQAGMVVE